MVFYVRTIFVLLWVSVFLVGPLHAESNAALPKEITTNYTPAEVEELKIIRTDLNSDEKLDWVVVDYGSIDVGPIRCGSQGCNYEAYLNMGDGRSCETYAVNE